MIINRALAGGLELNRALTELSRTYGKRKAEMHLTAANARRVVDTALELTGQPPLDTGRGQRTDAEVFEVPALGSAWQPALRGLETRLNPGVLRPVTFDDQAGSGPETTSCTSISATRSCSARPGSCAARCSARTRRSTGSPRSSSRACPSRASPRCRGWSWSGAAACGCTRRCS